MFRASNKIIIKCFYHILWMVFFAKIISLSIVFLLPYKISKDDTKVQSGFEHVNMSLKKIFYMTHKNIEKRVVAIKSKPTLLIKDLILKGIYIDKDTAFAIIALKKKNSDVKILSQNELFNGYKILKIYPKKIFLTKYGKIYALYLKLKKDDLQNSNQSIPEENVPIILKREDVYKYATNFDKIWKEIRIDDVRKKGKLKGFVIKWIKSGSIFSKIGLKKGDKIIKVDGNLLKSYADAFNYYEKLKKKEINILRLTVIRDNKEKEIEYELF